MKGLWLIDNVDMYQHAGAMILKDSYLHIMSPPAPKKRLEHDYADKNGVTVDSSSELKYEPKRFKMMIAISGDSSSQFWSRYEAFFQLIDKPQAISMYLVNLGVTIYLHYEGAQCVHKSRSFKEASAMAVYEVSFLEADPTNRVYD